VTLQQATTHSINSAFVDLVTQIPEGPSRVQQMAESAGVPADGHWDLSNRIPLGNSEVSPLNQALSYSTFANNGLRHEAHVVTEVLDANGQSRFKADTEGTQTVHEDVAIDVSNALTKVTQDGTGRTAGNLPYPVAGKTGSAYYKTKNGQGEKMVAAWFVGFTKQISTAVMYVKGDQGTDDLGRHFFGSGFPASTWLAYMTKAMDGKDRLGFDPPTHRTSTQSPTAKPTPTVTPTVTPTATDTPTATGTATTDPTGQPTGTTTPTTDPTKPADPKPTDTAAKGP
jgi:membrane peptidoglycan carboxypeptidase